MSKFDIYDEHVVLTILRNGKGRKIPFCELENGDVILTKCPVNPDPEHFPLTVFIPAHQSDDSDYEGWLFNAADGNGYFPEDFGAELTRSASGKKREYRVPLIWQMFGCVYVEAETEEEAIEIALGSETPLPNGYYVEDSCVVDDTIKIEVTE